MKNKKFIAALVITIIMFLVFDFGVVPRLVYTLAPSLMENAFADKIIIAIVRYSLAIFGYIMLTKFCGLDFSFKKKSNLRRIVGTVIMFILLAIVNMFIKAPSEFERTFIQALPTVLFMFIYEMGTGFFEEMLMRGGLFNAFRFKFGESKKGIVKAIICSSILFGLWHMGNLLWQPVVATISQVFYSAMIGCVFAAIYYITDNLWVGIIIHGIFDFTAFVWECFATPAAEDISIMTGVLVVLLQLPVLIAAVVELNREFDRRGVDKEQLSNT